MKHLFKEWPNISQQLENNYGCIFLDYDGTLTEIADKPQAAFLSKEMRDTLKKIAKNAQCQIIIVSGRSLKNIKKMVGIKNIIYAGSHGLEFGDSQSNFEIPVSSQYKILLKKIKKELVSKLTSFEGILIEEKIFSLCLHYRLANKKNILTIKKIFNDIVGTLKAKGEIEILAGKKVLEIIPPIIWDKGKIVLLILALLKCMLKNKKIIPFYIGDDVTDENAFDVLVNDGITVRVGKKKATKANYYVKNTKEVNILLEIISSFISD